MYYDRKKRTKYDIIDEPHCFKQEQFDVVKSVCGLFETPLADFIVEAALKLARLRLEGVTLEEDYNSKYTNVDISWKGYRILGREYQIRSK